MSPGSAWSGFGVQDDIRAGELRGRRAAGGLAGGQEAAPLKVVGSGQAGLACTNDHHIRAVWSPASSGSAAPGPAAS